MCQKQSTELASDAIWSHVAGERLVIVAVGLAFAFFTLVLYLVLIHKHRSRGQALMDAAGVHFVPYKLQIQESIIWLGPVMTICYIVQMCAPELTTMAEMFSTTFKAISYYYLMKYTGFQFGELYSLYRDDGTGTVQQHKPSKIYNKPPCCCVWIFCLPWMKERTVQIFDGRRMFRLVYQFCIIGPLMAILSMVAHYEGVTKDNIVAVSRAASMIGLASLLGAVYAINVMCDIVETCIPIQYQVAQRKWFTYAHGQMRKEQVEEPVPIKNIKVKSTWITFVTVLPILAGLGTSFAVTEDVCQDNGQLMKVVDYRNHLNAFIGILINFLGAAFAAKAFPIPKEGSRPEQIEHVAARYLEMELWPEYALQGMMTSIKGILQQRKEEGKVLSIKPSAEWIEAFGEHGDIEKGHIEKDADMPVTILQQRMEDGKALSIKPAECIEAFGEHGEIEKGDVEKDVDISVTM